jgi:polyisoprenoid-binding protein YceI
VVSTSFPLLGVAKGRKSARAVGDSVRLVPIEPGNHKLGPPDATLQVKTGKHGAAAMAGHNLVIEVTSWEAALDVGEAPGQITFELNADPGSLRVREGSGGAQTLGKDDQAKIDQTIAAEVLTGDAIEFRSTGVEASEAGQRLSVHGELTLQGSSRPISFELNVGPEARITGSATLKQSDWGMKPYSALFGTLKVDDELEVVGEAGLT